MASATVSFPKISTASSRTPAVFFGLVLREGWPSFVTVAFKLLRAVNRLSDHLKRVLPHFW